MDVQNGTLWTVAELAEFLRRSQRWVYVQLTRAADEIGSIPCLRLPGRRGGARFDPAEIRAWLRAGSPPVADWRRLQGGRSR